MSLDFDVSKILDHQAVTTHPTDKKKWHPVTTLLVWGSMNVGLGTITLENLDEWEFRIRMLQMICGADYEYNDGTKLYLTRKDLAMHIGLRTNVSDEKRMDWLKKLFNKYGAKLAPLQQEKSAHELINERENLLAVTKALEAKG